MSASAPNLARFVTAKPRRSSCCLAVNFSTSSVDSAGGREVLVTTWNIFEGLAIGSNSHWMWRVHWAPRSDGTSALSARPPLGSSLIATPQAKKGQAIQHINFIHLCASHRTNERTDAGGQWHPNWKLTRPARVRSSDFVRRSYHVIQSAPNF